MKETQIYVWKGFGILGQTLEGKEVVVGDTTDLAYSETIEKLLNRNERPRFVAMLTKLCRQSGIRPEEL